LKSVWELGKKKAKLYTLSDGSEPEEIQTKQIDLLEEKRAQRGKSIECWSQFHQLFICTFFIQKCFSIVIFCLCNFFRKNIGAKGTSKMLMKLTPEGDKACITITFLVEER